MSVKTSENRIAPKYAQMVEQLKHQIRSGELLVDDRLPSFTEMRAQYGATPATMERVYAVLEREGLIRREPRRGVFVAETSRRELTGLIGFVGNAFNKNQLPYMTHFVAGIEHVMSREEKRILLLDSESRAGWDQVDGVIACRPQDPKSALRLMPTGMPCVSLCGSIEGIPSVIADDFGGAKKAVQYLLSLGHKRIACLAETQFPISRLRVAGYRDALQEGGIEPDPLWIRQPIRSHFEARSGVQNKNDEINVLGGEQSYRQWGYDNMREWLNDGWAQQTCTAIMAQNDLVAIGIIQALQEQGLRIPQDVSVIGFDGTEVCDHSSPRLTSIEIPFREIGSKGSEVLLQQIEARTLDSQGIFESVIVSLPSRIRVRESTMAIGITRA